jgi:predicted RNA-binding Zn ribbon-like protein
MEKMSAETQTNDVPAFDLSGGNLCLDFANTIDDRGTEAEQEHITSYRYLVAWAEQTQLLSREETAQLLAVAARQPDKADAALQQARAIREVIYRIFAALAQDEIPADADLARLNAALAKALPHNKIVQHEQHFAWDWTFDQEALDYIIWPVVRAAADLLTSDTLPMLRICAADDCQWLFMDTSKNQTRRWCNMKSCGNRAKARRHIERKKQATRTI